MVRRVLFCTSASTCFFLNSWVNLGEGRGTYYARYSPQSTVVVPVLCWEIVLTALLLAGWEFLRRRASCRTKTRQRLALLFCVAPLAMLALACLYLSPLDLNPLVGRAWFWPVAASVAVPVSVAALIRPHRPARWMQTVFLLLLPVLGMIVARGLWRSSAYPSAAYRDGALAPALSSRLPRRVVWIIFDELSENIAFTYRPAGLALPNLDRLRAESFYATAACSPNGMTETSMPALITGERVVATEENGPRDLRVRTANGETSFSAMRNVFDRARQLGANTALAGWFHPYGRLLYRSLTRCYWTPTWLLPGLEEPAIPKALPARMADRLALQLAVLPLAGHISALAPLRYEREQMRRQFAWLLPRACELAADPADGLVLLHLPVPHGPAITTRVPGRPGNYLDGVLLADQTLGQLRSAMEQADVWDDSAVLVSADHGWRAADWRRQPGWTAEEEAAAGQRDNLGVPFLLKLPHQRTALVYDSAFNTIVTADLLISILRGDVASAEDVSRRIEGPSTDR